MKIPQNRFQIEFAHKMANPAVVLKAAFDDLSWVALWAASGINTAGIEGMRSRAMVILRRAGYVENEVDG